MRHEFDRHGLAQGKFAWKLRLQPRLRRVYEVIYKSVGEELVVGMDCVFFKPHGTPPGDRDHYWPHADMDVTDETVKDWSVFQSVLAVWPLDENSSCTVVWPGSHKEIYDYLIESLREIRIKFGHAGPLHNILD